MAASDARWSVGSHGEKYFAREEYSQEGGISPLNKKILDVLGLQIFWIFSGGSYGEKYFAGEEYSQEGGIAPVIIVKVEIGLHRHQIHSPEYQKAATESSENFQKFRPKILVLNLCVIGCPEKHFF